MANFSSVTDSVPFRSALLIFLTDYCNNKKRTLTSCNIIPKCFVPSQGLACNTYHVPEGGACALASGVVLQNGRIVDQLPDVVTVRDYRRGAQGKVLFE